jgi:hypothetical protein
MALILKDRVKETSTTTGTGTLTLGGAVTGYQSFGSAIGNTNTTYYAIYLDGGSEWEVGLGTVGSGTLARTTVYASSNGGSLVDFSAGQKSVWGDYPALKAMFLDANGDVSETIGNITGITGHISTPDYIEFDTSYATTLGAGQLGWDGNNTLGLGMAGGNVIQRIGEDAYIYVKASSAITKGQLCMFTGAVGASSVVTAAPSTGVTNGQYIIGLAAESIALNGFGLIQVLGSLKGFDTSAFADGDILYYDSAVTGGLTKTYPTSGPIVTVCAVTNAGSGGSGSVQIRVSVTQRITAGTGISVSQNGTGTSVTNTAPDQTVAISSGTGISVTGTYPNFTVTNTAPSSGGTVTSVSGTAPIASSGGNTPTISISQASGTTDGYLSSTDWTTFNNKQPSGTYVTSVGATSPVTSSGGTTPTIAIPQATGSVSGYLSSTDWTTFNSKASAFTYTSTYVPFGQGTTTPNQSSNFTYDANNTLNAPQVNASNGIVVNSATIATTYSIPSGSNAMSAGPISIASGVTVTVPSGNAWVIV